MNKYTSLELSKKLYEAGFEKETESYYVDTRKHWKDRNCDVDCVGNRTFVPFKNLAEWDSDLDIYYPEFHYSLPNKAYNDSKPLPRYDILNDLCLTHAKELFGDELLCYDCGEKIGDPLCAGNLQIGTGTCNCSRQFENNERAYEYHAKMIMDYMLIDKEYAEKHLWNNCILNPNNK